MKNASGKIQVIRCDQQVFWVFTVHMMLYDTKTSDMVYSSVTSYMIT